VSPPDPANGDARYTEDLLAMPPPAVDYVTYVDAQRSGELVSGPSIRRPQAWRSPSDGVVAATRLALNGLRRTGALLPDPVQWYRVTGDFDLVHVHCIPVRFLGSHPPVALSDSAGTLWYWTAVKQVSEERAVRLLRREARLAGLVGYLHPSVRPDRARALAFFVAAGKDNLRRVRGDDFGAVVCPPGVPEAAMPNVSDGDTILFIASDFWLKGGDIALETFAEIQRLRSTAKLMIAGPKDPDPGIPGVEWLGPVSRQQLYEEVYPRGDVFLYPTRFDCAPLVVMEALAHGVPVVAPRAFAMPEMIREGENGRLFSPGDHHEAAKHVLELLGDAALLRSYRANAKQWFDERWSVVHRNQLLAGAYAEAVR
jgi:glycosyltransferase involved in cell wall biosynthesis